MEATKIRELYFLFMDELGEYFVVMDYSKEHAIETAKDWFETRVKFQHIVDEDYAERYGLDIY